MQSFDTGFPDAWLAGGDQLLHAAQSRLTAGMAPIGFSLAVADAALHMMNSPFRSAGLMARAAMNMQRLALSVASGVPAIMPDAADHRFADPAWRSAPFSVAAQGFLLAETFLLDAVTAQKGMSVANRRAIRFALRQVLDTLSPSNLPWLNPAVLNAAINSGGANFLQGACNAALDAAALVYGASRDDDAIGRDVAATPGKVVFRNALMELIQYAPAGGRVRPEPVLIVPAWIMKYYILDLSPGNSLIGYLVAQGYTVFAISWHNPGPQDADLGLDDYRAQGVMAAMAVIGSVCGAARIHACGYCLGGTLLAIAAAAMARDGDARLATLTLLAAQTDFTEAGELQLFINDDQLAFLADVMRVQGTLDSSQMAGAFQMLRSNDLVWSRAISRYLLGAQDAPNDLMQWNADGTRMPARMHTEYLRHLFLDNDLAEGRLQAGGRAVALEDITVPMFMVGTEADHIAPWHSVHKLHLLTAAEITFVLASGGHNAGIVSEPGHRGRHYRFHARAPGERYHDPESWVGLAEMRDGSWWPAWAGWLGAHSGKAVTPPAMGSAAYPPLAPAPGRYILEH